MNIPAGQFNLVNFALGFLTATTLGAVGLLGIVLTRGAGPDISGVPQNPTHGCAVFGGSGPPKCQNMPYWTSGTWQPPAGVQTLHVLLIGGGGGGGGNLFSGMGGSGGSSGVVINTTVAVQGQPLPVSVGPAGAGAQNFMQPGSSGGTSAFDGITAPGGIGGDVRQGGSAASFGASSGGGGSGGGMQQQGAQAGAGGDGGSNGGSGQAGMPGTDPMPIQGTPGGAGKAFPQLIFRHAGIMPGQGGKGGVGGASEGGGAQFDGGGGGGGGGILIGETGPQGQSGSPAPVPCDICAQRGQVGAGGTGFGAGGGGAANGDVSVGGAGAPGVVYVEW